MKRIILIIIVLLGTHSIYSQETLLASGGDATGSGGTSSYSIGQLAYTTNIGAGTVSQGVQQSIELFTLSKPELSSINLSAVTYPNPTSDYVVLKISDSTINNLSYKLININGKVIANSKIIKTDTQINMHQLTTGIYILEINQKYKVLKTFKIIKK